MVSIRTLVLEYVDVKGASHIRELHIEVLRQRPGTPEHTIRARLSEAVADGLLDRLGDGFYDVYAEDEDMTSMVSYPQRCSLWGDATYRGNCDGRLFKNLVLRYRARKVADPMAGSGTTRDVRRQGRYTALIKDVLNFPYGEIRSVIIKVQHNCTSDRKLYGKLEDVPIRHEYCVVFRKTPMEPVGRPSSPSGPSLLSHLEGHRSQQAGLQQR